MRSVNGSRSLPRSGSVQRTAVLTPDVSRTWWLQILLVIHNDPAVATEQELVPDRTRAGDAGHRMSECPVRSLDDGHAALTVHRVIHCLALPPIATRLNPTVPLLPARHHRFGTLFCSEMHPRY